MKRIGLFLCLISLCIVCVHARGKQANRELLIETARCINTNCFDEHIIQTLNQAGKVFDIPELSSYAKLRRPNVTDTCNQKMIHCLQQLITYSDRQFGKISYESVYLRFICSCWVMDISKWDALSDELYVLAQSLYQKEMTPANRELLFICQLTHLIGSGIACDPTHEREIINLLIEADSFYQNYPRTDIKQAFYSIAGNHLLSFSANYPQYAYWFGDILTNEGKNGSMFHMTTDTLYIYDSIPIYLTTTYFSKESMRCARELYNGCQADLTAREIQYIADNGIWEDNTDLLFKYLQEGYSYVRSYYGDNHVESAFTYFNVRRAAGQCQQTIPPVGNEKELISAYLLPDGIVPCINYLYAEMGLDPTNTLAMRTYCREMRNLGDTYFAHYPARRINAYKGDVFLQRQKAWGYENAFRTIVMDFENQSRNHVDWEMVEQGKQLSNLAITLFYNTNDALRIRLQVLKMIQQLASDTSLVFQSEYVQYFNDAIISRTIPYSIHGDFGYEYVLRDLEQIATKTSLNTVQEAIHFAFAKYYHQQNQWEKAKPLYSQVIEDIHGMQAHTNDTLYHRDVEIEAYIGLAYLLSMDKANWKELQDIIDQLENIYYSSAYMSLSIIQTLADYHAAMQEWEEADKVLDFALQQYDGRNLWDGTYVQIVRMKATLLMNNKADFEQCRLMTERLERDIRQIKDIGNYSIYIYLLQIMCQITNTTMPNDIIHYKNVRLLYETSTEYYEASGHQKLVYFNFLLPAYHILCQSVFQIYALDRPSEYYLLQDVVEYQVLPELLKMQDALKAELGDKYTESTYYWNVILDLIMAYDIVGEQENAEQYAQQLWTKMPHETEIILSAHYFRHYNAEKAMEHMQVFAENDFNIGKYGESAKRAFLLANFITLTDQHKWEESEKIAWEYYQLTQEYIHANIINFTQAELEHFLMQNGVGGMPIQLLVTIPDLKNNEKLVAEAYNINLQEKGLMLHKASRLQQAIEASGDSSLIMAFDSLRLSRRELMDVKKNALIVSINQEEIAKYEQLEALEHRLARATQHMEQQQVKDVQWQEVRDHLYPNEVAIEYVVNNYVAYALLLSKNKSPVFIPLEKALEGFQYLYTVLMDSTLNDLQKAEALYNRESPLYEAFWEPITPYLKNAKTIYFSPAGALNLISFQAIRVDENTCLIDKYDMHQLTSTALLLERNNLSDTLFKNRHAKVYGGIFYNDLQELNETQLAHMRQEYQTQKEKKTPVLLAKRNIQAEVFPFLPNTLHEADGIHHMLESIGVTSSEEIGYAPSEKAIRDLSGNSPEILHISTHGFFFSDPNQVQQIPYFQKGGELNVMTCSGLALSHAEDAWLGQTTAESKEDNILTSSEVSELDLRNTQLVVLSACQTGLGTAGADGVFGLQRGFKQAGVQSICASLWSVADRATSEMMQLFYHYWMSGNMTMHQAMKRAMQEQRNITPSPYYWAAFVLLDALD